ITIKENININIITPLGSEHERGTNVTIRFRLNDSCGRNITSVSDINISMRNNIDDQVYNCTTVLEEGSGLYNCTFNTSTNPGVMTAGGYDMEILSYKQYYNYENASINYVGDDSGFFIETAPILSTPQVNASGDGLNIGSWSEGWNFTVLVTDDDGDAVSVTLWKRQWGGSSWGPWQEVDTESCSGSCDNTLVSIYESGTYTAPASLGNWSFKLNCTDNKDLPTFDGNQYTDEIYGYNYTIEKDDMAVYYSLGSEETLDRNGTVIVNLSMRFYDLDQDRYLTGGEADGVLWVTRNGTDFEKENDVSTQDGGYINYSFSPGCIYDVGVQYWKMGLEGNDAYKDINSSGFYNVTLYAPLNGTIDYPDGQTYYQGELVPTWFTVFEEDCVGQNVSGVSYKALVYNSTDNTTTYNIPTSLVQDRNNGSYNYTFDTASRATKAYNIIALVEKQYYYPVNITGYDKFAISTAPELQTPLHSADNDGGWGENHTFQVNCRDRDGNNVDLYFWYRNNPTEPWQLMEQQLCSGTNYLIYYFYVDYFNCTDITPGGTDSQFKFNASDTYSFTADTGEQNFTIYKDDVSVSYVSGFGLNIERDGSVTGNFVLRINDTDRSSVGVGENVSGIFHVTVDNENYTTTYRLNTTANSRLNISFDPNCTHGYGQQKW
ncbi:MAG: hypothetical protein KAS32_10435, partial [Candidatus Peribacteraceae bacterium]|nr:hypothetical protein [Candidatus Peribacteraceae bacterium]